MTQQLRSAVVAMATRCAALLLLAVLLLSAGKWHSFVVSELHREHKTLKKLCRNNFTVSCLLDRAAS